MSQPSAACRPTRRHAIGVTTGALAGLALAGTAHAVVTDDRQHAGPAEDLPEAFDEVFQGRRIQGVPGAGQAHHGGGYAVRIDGRDLHVMRNADGTWISVVNHYQTSPTPRALARAAVVELQGADLVPLG
ncbi:tyrosinase cofactor [Streptomyces sp. NPDC006711]|uniref:apotyrosinase chaperone MelC1 n=1 Tax=unclassified Streptomyces TaxID=2593676 RepID=UPI003405A8FD